MRLVAGQEETQNVAIIGMAAGFPAMSARRKPSGGCWPKGAAQCASDQRAVY
jgi:hypothetical protein